MTCKIIVDSCCDMTPQLKERLDVTSVPLTMRLGRNEFTDDASLDLDCFMAEMKASTEKVSSASPPPLLYQEAMESAGDSFVVTLSSRLSGSYASAVAGKTLAEETGKADTYIFDSKSASAGEVLIAVKIRDLLQKGMPKPHVIETINRFIEDMKTYFVLERYDNLQKNGRLNRIAGKLISVLNIKLMMGSDGNGNIALYAKLKGINQMVEKFLSLIENSGKKTDGENLVISHCNNPGLAERLKAAIEQRYHFKEIFIVPTGGISSLYADDGGIVLAF
ncbi:DegV family protein [Caproicibacter sp. BJN0012]|uniref:DegV family protein n=1 Tax=Caproicibacter sp. BJN0012 TaxID=3110227 RepID=UPI002E166A44